MQSKREEYTPGRRESTTMWEALEQLNELVDDSDPDTDLPQIAHALQTAEKMRADGRPDWMQLVGLTTTGQDAVLLWRAAMGGGGRHFSGRLPLLG
ncbi:MAG: inositol oxygenase family protein [Bryobacterales bacterium]